MAGSLSGTLKNGWMCEMFEYSGHQNLLVFSADGRYRVSAADGTSPRVQEYNDTTISIWFIGSMNKRRVLQGHSKWVTSIAFSPDNRYLASGSMDGTIKIWNTETGEALQTTKTERDLGTRHIV